MRTDRERAVRGALFIAAALAMWLFVGIYEEPEFSEYNAFLKHRPSLEVMFSSPLGMADRSFVPGREGYLTPEEEREEAAYREFVVTHRGWRRRLPLPIP